MEDDKNVVVVHCNAGKGRTGTSIAWFLMYWGLAKNATEAINYYGWKRFSTGKGVSQPCQLRYIHYFEAAFKKEVLWSVPKILECIIIRTVPKINQNGCKPYVDICTGDYKLIYTTKNSINLKKYKAGPKESEEYNIIKIEPEKKNLVISGDAHFFIKHKGSFNNTNIWRFSVNTGFIGNEVVIPRDQISPESVSVNKKFHDKFQITLVCRDYWEECTARNHLEEVCERCRLRMTKTTKEWYSIYEIIEGHLPYPTAEVGEKLCFYGKANCGQCKLMDPQKLKEFETCPHIDYHEVVNRKLVVRCDQYNLIKDDHPNGLKAIGEVAEGEGEAEQEQLHEDLKVSEDDDYTIITSKDDRNTMVADGMKLEEGKERNEEYFRSVNEFSTT